MQNNPNGCNIILDFLSPKSSFHILNKLRKMLKSQKINSFEFKIFTLIVKSNCGQIDNSTILIILTFKKAKSKLCKERNSYHLTNLHAS